jgi:hypothetical protein
LPLDALVGRGVLRRDERKVLGIFPADRYPGVVTGPEDAVRTRLRSVVLDGASADESTAAHVSVTRAADMVKQLFPGLDRSARKAAEARMKEISEGDWAGAAVKQALDEMYAAISVASWLRPRVRRLPGRARASPSSLRRAASASE